MATRSSSSQTRFQDKGNMMNESLSPDWRSFDPKQLSGRNRRLLHEWIELDQALEKRNEIEYQILERNTQGLPTAYLVTYHIHSIQGVERIDRLNQPGESNPPIFAPIFRMRINLPINYPCVDGPAAFRFLTHDTAGNEIPHPWHPNIRYFGEFAGQVCLNALNTHTSLAWCIDRVALYLRYDLYHAIQEPPYPEDPKVASWVIHQGEPNEWIFFDQPIGNMTIK